MGERGGLAQRADHGLVGAARIASICPTARAMPSSWPMAMICSMSAIEAKREVIVIVVLAAVAAVMRTSMDVVGRSSFGRPLSSANPSSISSQWGGSTAMTRHHLTDAPELITPQLLELGEQLARLGDGVDIGLDEL